MASCSRTTGEVDIDDNTNESPSPYSTLFSNKLIDLAISVDAEVLKSAQGQLTSASPSEEDGVNVFNTGSGHVTFNLGGSREECMDSPSIRQSNFAFNGHSRDSSARMDSQGSSISSGSSRVGQQCPTGSRSDAITDSLQASECNLLTVFSSPCTEYFPTFKKANRAQSEELPEYVRMIMEKDLALKRLVKTGSVTISQVKDDVGSEDDDKYLDEEDFYHDEYTQDMEYNGLYGRPYVPLGSVEDWDEFPFARRLLELAQMSLMSSGSVSPVESIQSDAVVKNQKSLISKEVKPVSSKSSVQSGSSNLHIMGNVQQQSFKFGQQIRNTASQKASRRSRSNTTPAESRRNSGIKTQKAKKNRQEPESDSEEQLSSFQVDPMKFLEVSLQEGKVPDDSHRRKYKCGFCEKKFCWSTDLKRHVLVHTGERPFICPDCPANFTRKFLLQKHLKKVHLQLPKPADCPGRKVPLPRKNEVTFSQNNENGMGGHYGEDLEFIKTECKEEDENFEDFDIQAGSEEDVNYSTNKFQTNGYTEQNRNNITYLDF